MPVYLFKYMWWLALCVVPVAAAIALHYFWGAAHELAHLAALKLFFRKDLLEYKIRLKWHRLQGENIWVPASINYTLAREETPLEHGFVAIAPHIMHALCAATFVFGAAFDNLFVRVGWFIFWGLGALDLVAAARTVNPYSDLYHAAECFNISISKIKAVACAWVVLCFGLGLLLCWVT